MNLTPTEMERLTIFTAAELARRYRSEGIKLSLPEATALIADELLLAARKGMDHPALVSFGAQILSHEDVEAGVPVMLRFLSIEVSMEEGTKLVTVFAPTPADPDGGPAPGELILKDGDIELNPGRPRTELRVLNTGDRSIQVRAHAHFFEVNPALQFDREAAFGLRLDRPSGGGERFDPGIAKTVTLVPFGGRQRVHGFSALTEGSTTDPAVRAAALERTP